MGECIVECRASDEIAVRGSSKRLSGRHHVDRLEQVRLPVPVGTFHQGHAGAKLKIERWVVAEVGEL